MDSEFGFVKDNRRHLVPLRQTNPTQHCRSAYSIAARMHYGIYPAYLLNHLSNNGSVLTNNYGLPLSCQELCTLCNLMAVIAASSK